MPDATFSSMRQSIIDGAPDTASNLAQQAVASGVAPIDAIHNGYVPGMHHVGEQFAKGQMFLPDMMASAEAMRAAMDGTAPEMVERAHQRVEELLSGYERHPVAGEQGLIAFAQREGKKAGLEGLPEILTPEYAPEPA